MKRGAYDVSCSITEAIGLGYIEVNGTKVREDLAEGFHRDYHVQADDGDTSISFGADSTGSVEYDKCTVLHLQEYSPMESHPQWDRFETTEETPTIFEPDSGTMWVTDTIPDGPNHALMYTGYGEVTDVDMSCRIHFEGNLHYTSYVMAKGIDFDNFVGVTSYNGKIMIYERVNAAWRKVLDTSNAGTNGKVLRMKITGNQAELFIDGVSKGVGTTNVPSVAYMGILLREHPATGLFISEMDFNTLLVDDNGAFLVDEDDKELYV